MHITCTEIGTVSTHDGFSICLRKEYREGLLGIEGFSHIVVIWYADKVIPLPGEALLVEKPYTQGPSKIGVFATRSPYRVNPLCVSVAKVIAIDLENAVIHLDWIDAQEGTPVLDIKPYHGSEDRVREYTTPSWCSHWPVWMEESEHFKWESEFTF